MGRRNINTTKSGKYMNPTDQARKEARKKELKKNKKQRQMVRAAVLKGKDPSQIILEMEKMDMMEYNVECQPTLSEKVLKDKRKKLKETLDRVMKLYEKENPEYWVELRHLEVDYEKKRQARIDLFEAVRHAQAVTVDEIPLPNLDMLPPTTPLDGTQLTVPATDQGLGGLLPKVGHGILKKPAPPPLPPGMEMKSAPGCPPTIPPELSDDEDEEGTAMDDGEANRVSGRTVRFEGEDEDDEMTGDAGDDHKGLTSLQAKLLRLSGQDIDDFMRETEVIFQEKVAERQRPDGEEANVVAPNLQQPPPGASGPTPPSGTLPFSDVGVSSVPPPPLMLRPPPPRPGMPMPLLGGGGVRMPMGGPPPRLPNMRLPPPLGMRPPMRPPGMMPPSAMMMPRGLPPPHLLGRTGNPNVLSAAPQLIARPAAARDERKGGATIEAKPQIRNLSADVTRFMPTALRVKREDKKKSSKQGSDMKDFPSMKSDEQDRKPTKDDAYSQFMQEMEGLL